MHNLRNFLAASAITFAGVMTASQAYAADIVDTSVSAGSFKTLVAAVQAAGFVDTLKGPGPFANDHLKCDWNNARQSRRDNAGCPARIAVKQAVG